MSLFKNNADLLDEAVPQVAGEPIDPRQVEEAAARVWARLSQEGAAGATQAQAPGSPRPPFGSHALRPPAASTAARISSP